MTPRSKRALRRAGDPWRTTALVWLFGLWSSFLGADPPVPRAAWCDLRGPALVPLDEASARQLRALPGIGSGRARDLIEAGQRRGAALELSDWASLPGLGAKTLAVVRRQLAARGSPGLSRPPGGPRASRGP